MCAQTEQNRTPFLDSRRNNDSFGMNAHSLAQRPQKPHSDTRHVEAYTHVTIETLSQTQTWDPIPSCEVCEMMAKMAIAQVFVRARAFRPSLRPSAGCGSAAATERGLPHFMTLRLHILHSAFLAQLSTPPKTLQVCSGRPTSTYFSPFLALALANYLSPHVFRICISLSL